MEKQRSYRVPSRGVIAGVLVALACAGPCFAGGGQEDEKGNVRLRVMIVENNRTPREEGSLTDNRWTRWAKEEMLRRGIAVEYVPKGSSQVSHTIMMATGTAPDVSFTHGRLLFTKFASDGGLHDLGPYLAEYGKNIQEKLGRGILDYGLFDGKQYAVPSRREYQARNASFIRADWLEALRLAPPRTRAELTEALRAFQRSDPGRVGAGKVVPWGYVAEGPGTVFESDFRFFDVMYSFLGHDPAGNMAGVWPLRDGFRDFMRWMNLLYREGLLEREFATDSDETKDRRIAGGQVGFVHCPWGHLYGQDAGGIAINLEKNVPGARYLPVDVFEDPAGGYRKLLNLPVHYYVFVPKRTRHPEAAVKYLDWLMEERTGWTLTFGIEGEHYAMAGGQPMLKDLQHVRSTFDYIAGYLRILDDYPIPRPVREAYAEQKRIKDFLGLDLEARASAERDGFQEALFTESMPLMMKEGPGLIKTCEKYWVRLLTEAGFDAVYAEFQAKLKSQGIEGIAAERAAYQARHR